MDSINELWERLTLKISPYKQLYLEASGYHQEFLDLYRETNKVKSAYEKAVSFVMRLDEHPCILDISKNDKHIYIWVFHWGVFSPEIKQGYIELYKFDYFAKSERIAYLYFEPSKNNNRIILNELQVSERDRGYGSKALNYLKYYGSLFGVSKIVGELSDVDTERDRDPNNGARLYHFYPKNGFSIYGDPPIQKLLYEFPKEK